RAVVRLGTFFVIDVHVRALGHALTVVVDGAGGARVRIDHAVAGRVHDRALTARRGAVGDAVALDVGRAVAPDGGVGAAPGSPQSCRAGERDREGGPHGPRTLVREGVGVNWKGCTFSYMCDRPRPVVGRR